MRLQAIQTNLRVKSAQSNKSQASQATLATAPTKADSINFKGGENVVADMMQAIEKSDFVTFIESNADDMTLKLADATYKMIKTVKYKGFLTRILLDSYQVSKQTTVKNEVKTETQEIGPNAFDQLVSSVREKVIPKVLKKYGIEESNLDDFFKALGNKLNENKITPLEFSEGFATKSRFLLDDKNTVVEIEKDALHHDYTLRISYIKKDIGDIIDLTDTDMEKLNQLLAFHSLKTKEQEMIKHNKNLRLQLEIQRENTKTALEALKKDTETLPSRKSANKFLQKRTLDELNK